MSKSALYEITALIGGRKTTATGKTVYQALEKLTPGNVHGRVILTVKKGNAVKDRIIPTPTARRMFNNVGLTREVALKNISVMFDAI